MHVETEEERGILLFFVDQGFSCIENFSVAALWNYGLLK